MKICMYCGKKLTGNQEKFCSKRCANRSNAPHFGTSAYRPLPEKESENCVACGKRLTGRQTKYCSYKCKSSMFDSYPSQRRRALTRKLEFIQQLGGRCKLCSYNKNLSGLNFHHERDKKLLVNRTTLARFPLKLLEQERDKCSLLCGNCHFALHNPPLEMNLLDQYRTAVEEQPLIATGFCTVCDKELEAGRKYFCSIKCKNVHYQGYEQQKRRGIVRKLQLVERLGGQCATCGYKRNLSALSFHHVSGKEYRLDLRSLANRSPESILAEFEKCQLLCINCHMELHYPDLDMARLRT